MIAKLIIKILKWKKLKGEDKTRIITALLDNINALPIRDAITFDQDGTVIIRGKKLDLEQAQNLKTGVNVLKDNFARKLIEEQILFECSKIGLHQGMTPEQIQFSKAAIWVLQQYNKFLEVLGE